MGIKRYIAASLIFIVAIGLYVFAFTGESLTKELFGYTYNLPVAIWIVVPVVLLMAASVVHMFYYWIKSIFGERSIKQDSLQYKKAVNSLLLGEDFQAQFKTDWFKFPYEILKLTQLKGGVNHEQIEDEQLREVVSLINEVNGGKFVELKKYKLDSQNPLVQKNRQNKLSTSPKALLECLKTEPKESVISKVAFAILVQNGSWSEIKKQDIMLDEGEVVALVQRYKDESIKDLDLEELLKSDALTREGYLTCAKILQQKVTPDLLLSLFEKLYNTKVEAIDAYLSVLLELQMIDQFRQVLEQNDEKELDRFRVLLFLRDNGKHYDLSLFA